MKIGVTERTDAGTNFDWVPRLRAVDGAILITKNISTRFISEVKAAIETGHKIIVHATTTGWGGTYMEPNVPSYEEQLNNILILHSIGLPWTNIVLRIDPIIPTEEGIGRMKSVIDKALDLNILPSTRVRISVLDNYPHVRERFRKAGLDCLYSGYFNPLPYMFSGIAKRLKPYVTKHNLDISCCAEPEFGDVPFIKQEGCISPRDLRIMELPELECETNHFKQRFDCLCLGNLKQEIGGTQKHRCPNQCLYCYWKD